MAAVPLIFEQQMIGRLVSQWASKENRWGWVGESAKSASTHRHETRLTRPPFRFTERGGGSFSNAPLRPLFLSRRLEKLFPHVVCRRRPLELFAAAAGGARTRTDIEGRGKAPKRGMNSSRYRHRAHDSMRERRNRW